MELTTGQSIQCYCCWLDFTQYILSHMISKIFLSHMCYIDCWSLTKVDWCILPHQRLRTWDEHTATMETGVLQLQVLPAVQWQADISFQRFKRLLKIMLFSFTLWLTVIEAVPHEFSSLLSKCWQIQLYRLPCGLWMSHWVMTLNVTVTEDEDTEETEKDDVPDDSFTVPSNITGLSPLSQLITLLFTCGLLVTAMCTQKFRLFLCLP